MAEYLVASGSRKISQLTQITALSQSAVIPVVMGTSYPITDGTTNQISYQNFRSSVILNNPNTFIQSQNVEFGSQKITLGANTIDTASFKILSNRVVGADFELFNNTSTDENTLYVSAEGSTAGINFYYADTSNISNYVNFLSVSTQNGILSFKRPTVITGSLTVTGGITANEYIVNSTVYTVTQSFSSGSTIFGNSSDDNHEITGSLKVSGSIALNTLTQNRVLLVGSNGTLTDSSTFTYNGTTLAVGSNLTIAQSTGNITTTGYVSINSNGLKVDGTINNPLIGAVTGALLQRTDSLNTFSSSQIGVNNVISAVTASINQFTSSQIGVNNVISIVTGSLNQFTASQIGVNNGIAFVTASLNAFTASSGVSNNALNLFTSSQIGVNNGIAAVTSSLNTFTSSQIGVNNGTAAVTASLNTFTSSQIGVNNLIAAFTSSQIGVNNLVAAFTSSQIGVNNLIAAFTSSQIGVNNGLAAVTASINAFTSSQIGVNNGISAFTASQIGVNNGISAFTASQIGVNNGIAAVTSSINAFTSSQIGVNNVIAIVTASLNAFTSSIRAEVNLIEAYTQSLKAAAIVSSSTQIENYFLFAETSSANTFYGTQEIKGNLNLSNPSPLVYNSGNTNAMLFGFFDGSSIYGPYYQIFGSNYSNVSQRGSAEFVFDSRNGGASGFNIAEFDGSTWLRKFRAGQNGVEVTGSLNVSGSTHTIENGFVILQQVSQSLNFADDVAAAAGGVPLGGLYRNGNFIAIRIS